MIYLGSSWCATTSLKKALTTLAAVVELRGTKLHIFENLSTTVITVDQPSYSGKSVTKSIGTIYHGVSGYGRGLYKPAGF